MGANPKFVVEDREDWTRVMWNGALGACVYVPRYMQEELALALAPQLAARVESLEADLKFARDGWKIMETQRDEAHAAVDRMKAEQAAHDADVRANGDAVIAGLNAKVAELRADLANMTEQYKSAKDYCDKADTLRFEAEAALEAAKKNPCGLCGIAAETSRRERDAAMAEVANLKASIEWRDETNAKLRVRLAERSDELVKRAALIEEARKEAADAKSAFDAHVERANAAVKRAVEMETARDVANMIAAHAKSYAADFDRCAGALQAAEKLVEELRGVAAESTSRLLRAEKAEARADGMERAGAEQARRADQNQADMVAWRARAEAAEARVKELEAENHRCWQARDESDRRITQLEADLAAALRERNDIAQAGDECCADAASLGRVAEGKHPPSVPVWRALVGCPMRAELKAKAPEVTAARTVQVHALVQEVVEKAANIANRHESWEPVLAEVLDDLFNAVHALDAAGITIQPVRTLSKQEAEALTKPFAEAFEKCGAEGRWKFSPEAIAARESVENALMGVPVGCEFCTTGTRSLKAFAEYVRDVGIRGQDDTVMRQRACEALGQKWSMEFTPSKHGADEAGGEGPEAAPTVKDRVDPAVGKGTTATGKWFQWDASSHLDEAERLAHSILGGHHLRMMEHLIAHLRERGSK